MKQESYSKKRVYIILAIMICVQLISIIYYFQFWKEGFHSDEIWSYAFANSYKEKNILQDQEGNPLYMGEWYDTTILQDCMVVNKGEQFEYVSVYENQIQDISPPFHSMILHTICSFFPEQFSKWFSFFINIVSFVVVMIYLFKITKMMKNDIFALSCCALYGFSLGARDTYIYLRMYALCTAMIMILLYHILCYIRNYKETGKLLQKHLLVIGIVSTLGFLSHHYVISFVGILTFFVCAFSFLKKDYKLTFGFGCFMLCFFLIALMIFPSIINVTKSTVGNFAELENFTFRIRMILLLRYILLKLFNVAISIFPSPVIPIVLGVCVFLLIVCMPLFFYLRNTTRMKLLVQRGKDVFLHPKRTLQYINSQINWIYVILFLTVMGQLIVVGETTNIYGMAPFVDRYLFFMYPVCTIIGMGLIYRIIMFFVNKNIIARYIFVVITFVLVAVNVYNSTIYCDYSFEREGDVDIEDVIKGKDCIYVKNESWMLIAMMPTLVYAEEFSQLQYQDYQEIKRLFEEKENKEIIVIIDASFVQTVEKSIKEVGWDVVENDNSLNNKVDRTYDEIITFLEGLEPNTKMKHLTTQTIFTRDMEVYSINP